MPEMEPRLDTSKSFEALETQDDASMDDVEDSQSNEDGTKNYINDPLEEDQQEVTSPKPNVVDLKRVKKERRAKKK